MPLLNIDIDGLAEKVLPPAMLDSFLALPVPAKLTGLATFAHIGGDGVVRDRALSALETLSKPRYVALANLRNVLATCNMLNRISIEKCDFLVGAGSSLEPPRQTQGIGANWYRRPADRWKLHVTAADMRDAVARSAITH